MLKLFVILPCLLLMFQHLNANVEAPNYDFSVDTLNELFPGKAVADIQSKYGKGEEINLAAGLKTHKFNVAHIRYKFPVLIQEKDGVVQDMFARLPSYFLHDIFLQSLVNRMGKQTNYKKVEEEAFYIWEKDGFKHVYSAACTITCFPIFYSVQPIGAKKSLLEQMQKASMQK